MNSMWNRAWQMPGLTALKSALTGAVMAGLIGTWAGPAHAQTYPSKPVRMVVSFAPGGVGDYLARTLQQHLQEKYGQPFVVENKAGASGTLGAADVARAAPDGHTLLITNQLIVQAPNLFTQLSYDPMRDLIGVTDLGGAPLILAVNAEKSGARTLAEFVDEVKRKPRSFSYGSVGIGSMGHLYGAQLNDTAGIDLLHVPYKGSAPVVTALLTGEVQSAFSDYATMKPHIDSGKFRLLAVSKPYAPTPSLPTFAAQGYQGLESYSWIGMFAPRGTPAPVIEQLRADVARVMRLPEVQARLTQLGLETGGMSPAQFNQMVADDFQRWAVIMKKAGIKPE
jgi:tripartite-type tricarboxylate transporter receptor subunit TctC